MIKATVIADSTNWLNKRITTLILEYPRYIHSEFMTHRVLSKNSASSRAIPIEKVIDDINEKLFYPYFTTKKKGMQGGSATIDQIRVAKAYWDIAKKDAIKNATSLNNIGIHKQNANRLLEPFFTMKVICTGTEWDNFFLLRNHPDAQPEIQELAVRIKHAMDESTPKFLQEGEWHIPFGDKIDIQTLLDINGPIESEVDLSNEKILNILTPLALKIAAARCARISYNPPELDKPDYNRDIELFDRLVSNHPRHLSPLEHIARVPTRKEIVAGALNSEWVEVDRGALFGTNKWEEVSGWAVSNLKGWIQYRKLIELK